MKQINEKLNKIAKAIDETVELPETDLIIDSLDAITKALGGTPNDSHLIVDKLEAIAGVASGGGGGTKQEFLFAPELDYLNETPTEDGNILLLSPLPVPYPDNLKVKVNGTDYVFNFGVINIEDGFSGYRYYNETANLLLGIDTTYGLTQLYAQPITMPEAPPEALLVEIWCDTYPPVYSIMKTTFVNSTTGSCVIKDFINEKVIYALSNGEVIDVTNTVITRGDGLQLDIMITNEHTNNYMLITSTPSNPVNCMPDSDTYIYFDVPVQKLTNAEITLTLTGGGANQ